MKALVATLFLAAVSAQAANPCKEPLEAKHTARKALHECIESWAKNRDTKDQDPAEDCSVKLSAFVQAAKAVKACRISNHQPNQPK